MGRHIPAQIQHVEAVIFQHGFDDILADVVNVALHRGDQHARTLFLGAAASVHGAAQHLKHPLGRLGRAEQLGQERPARFVFRAHAVQRRDEAFLYQGHALVVGQRLPGQAHRVAPKSAEHGFLQGKPRHGGRSGGRRGQGREPRHIIGAPSIPAGQHPAGGKRVHQLLLVGVEDGQGQTALHRTDEECLGHQQAVGQAEGNVAHPQHGLQMHFLRDRADGTKGFLRLLGLGGGRQGQAVDPHILIGNAKAPRTLQNEPGDGYPLFGCFRQTGFVQGQTHHRRAVALHQRQDGLQRLFLTADRVDRRLAVIDPQGCVKGDRIGGVQLQRQIDGGLQCLDHPGQHGCLVHAGIAHIYIQNVRARVHLGDGHIDNIVHVAGKQGLLKALFACGVDALANHPHAVDAHHPGGGAQIAARFMAAGRAGEIRRGLPQGADVVGACAAAAAQQRCAQLYHLPHGGGKLLR